VIPGPAELRQDTSALVRIRENEANPTPASIQSLSPSCWGWNSLCSVVDVTLSAERALGDQTDVLHILCLVRFAKGPSAVERKRSWSMSNLKRWLARVRAFFTVPIQIALGLLYPIPLPCLPP